MGSSSIAGGEASNLFKGPFTLWDQQRLSWLAHIFKNFTHKVIRKILLLINTNIPHNKLILKELKFQNLSGT